MEIIETDIQKLIDAHVIDNDTAQSMREYYHNQKRIESKSQNIQDRKKYILTILFSIFGALSIGAGIVLIFAHNWTLFSRSIKIGIVILILFIAQILCAFALIQKIRSVAWREGSICFLYFSFGTSIALISQAYHIPSNISQFLFIVLMFTLPFLYIFRSYALSLLYILTTVWLLLEVSILSKISAYSLKEVYSFIYILKNLVYLIPFIASLLFYYQFQKSIFSSISLKKLSIIITIQNWCISLAFLLSMVMLILVMNTISVFSIFKVWEIGYILCFQILYVFGNRVYPNTRTLANAYRVVGILGILIVMYYIISIDTWYINYDFKDGRMQQNFLFLIVAFLLSLLVHAFVLSRPMSFKHKRSIAYKVDMFEVFYVLFLFILVIQESAYQIGARKDDENLMATITNIVIIVLNVLILSIAVFMLLQSITNGYNIRQLNFSVFIIIVWMVLRFLNTDTSYLIRGIVFVVLGIVFLKINLLYLKNRNDISVA